MSTYATYGLSHFFDVDDGKEISLWRIANPSWNPPDEFQPLENALLMGFNVLEERIYKIPHRILPIFPRRLKLALDTLRGDKEIVIKPADKNLGLVLMNKTWYLAEAHLQFSDERVYQSVQRVPWDEIESRLDVLQLKHTSTITQQEWNFIRQLRGYKACTLYFLPKVHKSVDRPICPYIGYIFEHASVWLHHQLLPILLRHRNHLVDSLSFLRDVSKLHVPSGSILFTFDMESLYPSIPTDEGLAALRTMIAGEFPYAKEQLIMSLASLVLT